jgi:hypothetical protein
MKRVIDEHKCGLEGYNNLIERLEQRFESPFTETEYPEWLTDGLKKLDEQEKQGELSGGAGRPKWRRAYGGRCLDELFLLKKME